MWTLDQLHAWGQEGERHLPQMFLGVTRGKLMISWPLATNQNTKLNYQRMSGYQARFCFKNTKQMAWGKGSRLSGLVL